MGDIGPSPSFKQSDAASRNPLAVASLTTPDLASHKVRSASAEKMKVGRSHVFTCPSLNESLQSHGATRPADAPKFRLQIRQHPEHGLAVGNDESAVKNARATPLDPPPICELVPEQGSDLFISVPEVSVQARLVHCDDPCEEVASSSEMREPMVSGLQESGFIAPTSGRHEECLFVFAELGVRKAGDYRIRFDLIDRLGLQFRRLASVYTLPFSVVSDKKRFAGLRPSTELVCLLVKRGLKLRIVKTQGEKKVAKRQKTSEERTKEKRKERRGQKQGQHELQQPSPSVQVVPPASLAATSHLHSLHHVPPWPSGQMHSIHALTHHPPPPAPPSLRNSGASSPSDLPFTVSSAGWPRSRLTPPFGPSSGRRMDQLPYHLPTPSLSSPSSMSKRSTESSASISSTPDREPFHRHLPPSLLPLPHGLGVQSTREDRALFSHSNPTSLYRHPAHPEEHNSRRPLSAGQISRPILPPLSSLGAFPAPRSPYHTSAPSQLSYSHPFL